METVDDILRKMRSMKSLTMHDKIWINTIRSLADRIEKALKYTLAVERKKAAGRGYVVGKQTAMEMKRIVLDCSKPEEGCENCVFNRDYGCGAPKGLDDCYKHRGVWVIIDGVEGGQK